MKILKEELKLWDKVRKEFENDFHTTNTGIAKSEFLMTLYKHKLQQLKCVNHAISETENKNGK